MITKTPAMATTEPAPLWLQRSYLLLFAALPWSVELPIGAWQMDIPAEPLMALLGIGLGWQVCRKPAYFYKKIFTRPVLLWSLAWLCWMAASASRSSMPIVSWKYWIVECGHWWVFAVGLAAWPMMWGQLARAFAYSMAGLIVYTLAHHAQYHFRADQSLLAPMPFFPEHTTYAAALAMSGWILFAEQNSAKNKTVFFVLASLFAVGLWLSHCRAAWVSVAVAAGLAGFIHTWQRRRMMWILAMVSMLSGIFFFRKIIFEKIKTATAHDVSTLERLNRYACAARMAAKHPLTGFGPGTFQFQYLPYQRPEEMTRISLRSPLSGHKPETFGRGGGAHSELGQAWADTGWPGLLLWLSWALAVFLAILPSPSRFLKPKGALAASFPSITLRFAILLSLATFFLHGLINDLLHDSCIAAWVWGQLGVSAGWGFEERATPLL